MGALKERVKELNQYERLNQGYFIGDGIIKKYDIVSKTASIEYGNPNGSGTLFKSNVPVILDLENIKPGVKCTIVFQGGKINSPAIIGIYDLEHSIETFNQKQISTREVFLSIVLLMKSIQNKKQLQ